MNYERDETENLRVNLLRPLAEFLSSRKVLEIGTRHDTITEFLEELGCDVTVPEYDPQKGIAGQLETDERFGAILLIGAPLEDIIPSVGGDLSIGILDRLRKKLTSDGCLVMAGNNFQPGAEVWREKLAQAGFSYIGSFYPFPNAEFPEVILTERALEQELFDPAPLVSRKFGSSQRDSFLIVAGGSSVAEVTKEGVLAYTYTNMRQKSCSVQSTFENEGPEGVKVHRQALFPGADACNSPIMPLVGDGCYAGGRSLQEELREIVACEGWSVEDMGAWAKKYYEIISRYGEKDGMIGGEWLDLTPSGIILTDDDLPVSFDLKWSCRDKLPLFYVFFRGLTDSLDKLLFMARPVEGTPLHTTRLAKAVADKVLTLDENDLLYCVWLEENYFSDSPVSSSRAFAERDLCTVSACFPVPEFMIRRESQFLKKARQLALKDLEISGKDDELATCKKELAEKTRRIRELKTRIDQMNRPVSPKEGLEYSHSKAVKVSLIIPTDNYENVRGAIRAITGSTKYPDYEIWIVSNQHLIDRIWPEFSYLPNIFYASYDKPHDFSNECNEGAKRAKGLILVFLNDSVRPMHDDWLEKTIEYHRGTGSLDGVQIV